MFPCVKKIEKDIIKDRFNNLPHEIASEILTRLPSESVLHCKLVCRNWRKLVDTVINDPSYSFSQKHLYHHLNHPSGKLGFVALTEKYGLHFFEYNDHELTKPIEKTRKLSSTPNFEGRVVGSCNGLICLATEVPHGTVCICNHFTKEYLLLPEIRTGLFDKYDIWWFGFGYLPATNEYKVVGIYGSNWSSYLEVYIYTIGSGNGWRTLGRNFSMMYCPMRRNEHGSFANGSIYWIGVVNRIVVFDLVEEKFCQHLAPPIWTPERVLVEYAIGVLDGVLYIPVDNIGDNCLHVWLLNDSEDKKEGDEHQSLGWSKEQLRVDETKLLAVTKSGGVLTYRYLFDYINLYDRKASTSKTLVKFDDRVLQVFPHTHTFVSLRELGEKHTEKMQSLQGDRKP